MAIKLLDESIVNEDKGSYVVKRVIFDVAFKDEDHCRRFAFVGGAGNRDVANAIFSAVEEAGFELAGDMIESTDDLTDIYRSNDYYDFYGIKDYLVKRVELDVAARDEEHAKKLDSGFGAPTKDRSLFNCLDDALEKCGYEMAGDGTSCEDDYTDVYMDNDYEFFTEAVESDEYKSYKDQWEKNYKGKNRPQKEVDDFITSAWNELNHGENKFTGDEFKKLCADAGVDANKFMKESSTITEDEDDYPYTTGTGKRFRKSNQSGLDGEVEITIPSFTIKYKVKEGLQFKDPDGFNSNDDAELHLVADEQDRIDKLIKDAAMAEMEKRGFSAYSGHSALVGIPATIRFSKKANESVVNEGNPVSSKLPETIDSFLQDIAQIHGTISYGDIMDHDYTDEDIKKLRSLRRKWREEAQYEEDPDAQKACQDVAEKVAKILKSTVTEDYDMANPKDAEDIDLELRASLSVKTYEAVEALQMPRFRMKLRELVGGFGAELHNCSVDETDPIDMED